MKPHTTSGGSIGCTKDRPDGNAFLLNSDAISIFVNKFIISCIYSSVMTSFGAQRDSSLYNIWRTNNTIIMQIIATGKKGNTALTLITSASAYF